MNRAMGNCDKERTIYEKILNIYPSHFRREYKEELLLIFEDMYKEKRNHNLIFWARIFSDTYSTLIQEYYYIIQKNIMLETSNGPVEFNRYNIIGFICLIPFFAVFLLDLIARIIQKDISRPNLGAQQWISHTPLYIYPILVTWLIILPAIAIFFNLIPLLNEYRKNKGSILHVFVTKKYILNILIVLIALGFIGIVKFHDFAPCIAHNFFGKGNTNIPALIEQCKKA